MIAIDPGATGGIAYDDMDRDVVAIKMPETYPEIFDTLKAIMDLHPSNDVCIIEDVGTYMPGNSGPAAVDFARHCGHLDMALYALQLRRELVRPQKWQKLLSLPTFEALPKLPAKATKQEKLAHGRELAKRKTIKKNAIKEKMQTRFPKLKVTLAVSDALAIYCYGRNEIR